MGWLRHLLLTAAASAAAFAGCGGSGAEPPHDVAGGGQTTTETSLTIAQIEREAQQYSPEAKQISCAKDDDGPILCDAQIDGRPVTLVGTPTEDTVGFTFGTGGE